MGWRCCSSPMLSQTPSLYPRPPTPPVKTAIFPHEYYLLNAAQYTDYYKILRADTVLSWVVPLRNLWISLRLCGELFFEDHAGHCHSSALNGPHLWTCLMPRQSPTCLQTSFAERRGEQSFCPSPAINRTRMVSPSSSSQNNQFSTPQPRSLPLQRWAASQGVCGCRLGGAGFCFFQNETEMERMQLNRLQSDGSPRLIITNKMDSKGVQAGLIIAVIAIQAINLATVGKSLDFTHYIDDLTSTAYSNWNSTTTTYSYQLGFAVAVSGLTILLYGLLLVVKLAAMNISAKIQEILYAGVAVLQFSLGVLLAIVHSRLYDPDGPNSGSLAAIYKLEVYKNMYKIELADVVLLWVICIPASYLLAHFNANQSAEPAKAQTSEMAIRN